VLFDKTALNLNKFTMARKARTKKSKKVKEIQPESEEEMENEEELNESSNLLAEIDAMSDDEGDENEEWDAEAKALRQAIAEGAFDKLKNIKPFEEEDVEEEDEEEAEEEAEEKEEEEGQEEEEEEEGEAAPPQIDPAITNIKALQSVAAELANAKASLPWPEKFNVTPTIKLPFGTVGEDGLKIEIHDDLKREVVFHNLALESVHMLRSQCDADKIPFTRPVDFFAEMVKTDDHMSMVKDKLIFETKKMEAFEHRKSNREQKLRAKEKHAHRIDEKNKFKKQHMREVKDWADSAANNRAGGGRVRDNDNDYLNNMGGPNKKRQAMDRKFGHGGKNGRFKQNDKKSMNDMSGYNPKGNFSGGNKSGGSGKRKGKRARDAARK